MHDVAHVDVGSLLFAPDVDPVAFLAFVVPLDAAVVAVDDQR